MTGDMGNPKYLRCAEFTIDSGKRYCLDVDTITSITESTFIDCTYIQLAGHADPIMVREPYEEALRLWRYTPSVAPIVAHPLAWQNAFLASMSAAREAEGINIPNDDANVLAFPTKEDGQ
jgi:hypothetical protein